jgi:LuxR family maltose regulon positive regulatory protein
MMMEKEVLMKVTRPHINKAYQRADLYNLLDELSATPLIRVCSCPGSGKTTLLASYIKIRNIPSLWYRLEQDDEGLAAFFHNLRFAAAGINSDYRVALSRLSPARVFNVTSLAKEYFQKLYQSITSPFMFVFDNYPAFTAETALHEVIGEACAALPRGGRIVLISDSNLAPHVPNLPADLAVATLCCDELQLSLREVKEITAFHGVRLPSDQAARKLHNKTEGWIARLVHELQREGQSQ